MTKARQRLRRCTTHHPQAVGRCIGVCAEGVVEGIPGQREAARGDLGASVERVEVQVHVRRCRPAQGRSTSMLAARASVVEAAVSHLPRRRSTKRTRIQDRFNILYRALRSPRFLDRISELVEIEAIRARRARGTSGTVEVASPTRAEPSRKPPTTTMPKTMARCPDVPIAAAIQTFKQRERCLLLVGGEGWSSHQSWPSPSEPERGRGVRTKHVARSIEFRQGGPLRGCCLEGANRLCSHHKTKSFEREMLWVRTMQNDGGAPRPEIGSTRLLTQCMLSNWSWGLWGGARGSNL